MSSIPVIILLAFALLAAILQLLFWEGRFTTFLINHWIRSLDIEEFQFLLSGRVRYLFPGRFSGRKIRLYVDDGLMGEKYQLELPRFRGKVLWRYALKGKIVVMGARFVRPVLEVDAFGPPQKIDGKNPTRPVPDPGALLFEKAEVVEGTVLIRDRSQLIPADLPIKHINIRDGGMDVGVPISLFFLTRFGEAQLADAPIQVWRREEEGRLVMEGFEIRRLAGLGSLFIEDGVVSVQYNYRFLKNGFISGHAQVHLRRFQIALGTGGRENDPAVMDAQQHKMMRPEDVRTAWESMEQEVGRRGEVNTELDFNFRLGDYPGTFDRSLAGLLRSFFTDVASSFIEPAVAHTVKRAWYGIRNFFSGRNKK